MFLTLVAAAALTAAVDAPVTHVTVYSDRARVTRTAQLDVNGNLVVELPLLQQSIDPGSVRVEATGAEVRRVDLQRTNEDEFPTDEAKKLLAQLHASEDKLAKMRGEKAAHDAQIGLLQRIAPLQPTPEPQRNVPKLNASGWLAAMTYATGEIGKLQEKSRVMGVELVREEERYTELADKARILGGVQRRQGYRVMATLSGSGTAKVSLIYVTARARWYPLYELQLVPDTGKVQITFSGLVSQETGEDWTDANLTLSTAMPARVTVFPKIPTWKIGDRERFIPTPYPVTETIKPPPSVPPLHRMTREEDVVRQRLMAEVGQAEGQGKDRYAADKKKQAPGFANKSFDFNADSIEGDLAQPEVDTMEEAYAEPEQPMRMPPPPPPKMERRRSRSAARDEESMPQEAPAMAPMSESVQISSVDTAGGFFESDDKEYEPTQGVSLSPPRGWVPPTPPPESPAALAGGYDLAFASLRPESVGSGKGQRRVPLFNEAWPVTVERKLFPGVAKEAYLVAEIKSPSKQVLPAGNASLFVGEDPAGNARLPLVSPGEPFTLPLGLDRAIKPVRNVKVSQAERGFIGKEEITEYVVTVEVSNPHSVPVALRIFDQWPIASSKDLESRLLKTEPYAIQDQTKGTLEWRITLAPKQKKSVSFTYTLRRPKGWRLYQ